MLDENAQSEESTARGQEDGEATGQVNPGREGRAGAIGGEYGTFSIGADGASRPWQDTNNLGVLTGGVVEQMILDAQDRLRNAEECIEWYEREKQKEVSRLDNLRKLRELAERVRQSQQLSE